MEFSVINKLVVDRVWIVDYLAEVVKGFTSTSSTSRKIALACWAFTTYKGMSPPGIDHLLGDHSYIEDNRLFYTYDVKSRAEHSYLKSKNIFKASDAAKQRQVVLYFMPHKFVSEGRLYRMMISDIERLVVDQKWSALPDPKSCFCWTHIHIDSTSVNSNSNNLNSNSSNQSIENDCKRPSQRIRLNFKRNEIKGPTEKRMVSFSPSKNNKRSSRSPNRKSHAKRMTQIYSNSFKAMACHAISNRGFSGVL